MSYRKIFSIGDSHSGNFNGIGDNITDIHLGPITMYQVSNQRTQFQKDLNYLFTNNIKEKINTQDILLLYCMGEIDIRCNWEKQINQYGKDEDQLIENLIDSLFTTLLPLHNPFGFQSIVPAVRREHILIEDKNYPVKGSNEDRVRWVKKTNTYLKQKCIEKGCVFFDIWGLYADGEGHMRLDLSDGGVHVLNKSLIGLQLKKQKLI
jgi:hypothetical protein